MKKWRVTVLDSDQTGWDPDDPKADYFWFDTEQEARSFPGEPKVEELEVIEFYGVVAKPFVDQERCANLVELAHINFGGFENLAVFDASDGYKDTHWKAVRGEWGDWAVIDRSIRLG